MSQGGETRFRIAVLGDFSGRANRHVHPPLRSVPIDPDSFEDVMERLGVALDLPGGAASFRELDDFHPDRLYQNLRFFQPIHEARKWLADPQVFSRALAQAQTPPPPPPVGGGLLDMIAAQSEPAAPARVAATDEAAWDQAIRKIAVKHATPARDPRQEQAIALVDQAAAAQLRALLSHPDFQALEAAWRSIFFLFRYVETSVDLQIELIDISKDELLEKQAELAKILEPPWSVLAGLFTFSAEPRDIRLLARLGAIARHAGAPFIGAMNPNFFGCESMAESSDPDDWKTPLPLDHAQAWEALRRSADATWIGLAFPRFLLRLPYGKKTSPIEGFDFEEMPNAPTHDAYLWGNPAVACVALLGQSFTEQSPANRLEGLPIHTFPTIEPTPPAEIWMTERFAGEILDAGVMPLASVKHSDAIQLVRFQSIAHPTTALAQPLAGPC